MEFHLINTYDTLEDLKRGLPMLGEAIETHGLPLDTVWLIDGRVAMVTEIDYEEGQTSPLVRRYAVDPAVTRPVFGDRQDGRTHKSRHLLVDRHGRRHFV